MESLICPKCGVENPPDMAFCSNCGQSLAAVIQQSGGNAPDFNPVQPSQETIFSQPKFNQPNFATQTFNTPTPAIKKSGKGLLFGLLGCGTLLVISVIALVVGIPLLKRAGIFGGSPSASPENSNLTNYNLNSNKYNSKQAENNSNAVSNSGSSDSELLSDLQAKKQVGSFKQTSAKTVVAKDFFPLATEAAQALYTDGTRYVAYTSGKFPSNEIAKNNFDNHISNIKNLGGTIYSNEAKDNLESAVYKYKDVYFTEACGGNTCIRTNASELKTVTDFLNSFDNASDSSSPVASQSPTGNFNMVGIWKGIYDTDSSPTTLNITSQDGDSFTGTLKEKDYIVEFNGQVNHENRSVAIKETKVIKQGKDGNWLLGNNTGTITENGKTMSGTGEPNSYSWSFTRQ
ncbi:MAG: zinc ribbon domain-containing protein [Pyrinomonadaceae bacterium]